MRAASQFIRNWWFGLVLLGMYLAVFNFWMLANKAYVVPSTIAALVLLLALLPVAAQRRYFLNRWDVLLHLLVIADILLEGTLLHEHDSPTFYLCAAAFALVIAGYRLYLRRRQLDLRK